MEDNNEKIEELEKDVVTDIDEFEDDSNMGKVLIVVAGLAIIAVGGLFIFRKYRKNKEITLSSNSDEDTIKMVYDVNNLKDDEE